MLLLYELHELELIGSSNSSCSYKMLQEKVVRMCFCSLVLWWERNPGWRSRWMSENATKKNTLRFDFNCAEETKLSSEAMLGLQYLGLYGKPLMSGNRPSSTPNSLHLPFSYCFAKEARAAKGQRPANDPPNALKMLLTCSERCLSRGENKVQDAKLHSYGGEIKCIPLYIRLKKDSLVILQEEESCFLLEFSLRFHCLVSFSSSRYSSMLKDSTDHP